MKGISQWSNSIRRFEIKDRSMEPQFREGDFVIASSLSYILKLPKVGDVVVARHPSKREMVVITRIAERTCDGRYVLVGDNASFSTESREFGPVAQNDIIGEVLLHVKS